MRITLSPKNPFGTSGSQADVALSKERERPSTIAPIEQLAPLQPGRDILPAGPRCAQKALGGGELDRAEISLLVNDRQARVEFFAVLQEAPNKRDACAALHSVIAADGPTTAWFLRKTAFEYLRQWSSIPLTDSLRALASAPDYSLKAAIIDFIVKDLSFPLSAETRQEVMTIGTLGGELCNKLLVQNQGIQERQPWVSKFPNFVRAWLSACSAVGVMHGVDATELARFSRSAHGPLNDWHLRRALEPSDPLSWSGVQAAIRRTLRL